MSAASAGTTHQTAATQSVDAAGVSFAYRRFGSPSGLPLVMLQHFRGNLDNWDPALTNALAAEREIVLVDYPGRRFLDGRAEGLDFPHGARDDRVHRRARPA